MPKKEPRTMQDLSPKEMQFCKHFTEIGGDHYSNRSSAARAAGYTSNSSAAAARMLKRPAIRAYCQNLWQDNCDRHNITPSKVLSDLEDLRRRSIDKKDYSTATRCAELCGKFLSMFHENFNIDTSAQVELDERKRIEAVRLANIRCLNIDESIRPAPQLAPGQVAIDEEFNVNK